MNQELIPITEADMAQARELADMFGGNGITSAHQLQIVAGVVARLRARRERAERALEFVHEIAKDELREGHEGHGGVMLSLESIARQGRGLPTDETMDYLNPADPQPRSKLATLLADTYLALVVAGRWDICDQVKAERDRARQEAARLSTLNPQLSTAPTAAPTP